MAAVGSVWIWAAVGSKELPLAVRVLEETKKRGTYTVDFVVVERAPEQKTPDGQHCYCRVRPTGIITPFDILKANAQHTDKARLQATKNVTFLWFRGLPFRLLPSTTSLF